VPHLADRPTYPKKGVLVGKNQLVKELHRTFITRLGVFFEKVKCLFSCQADFLSILGPDRVKNHILSIITGIFAVFGWFGGQFAWVEA